MQTDPYRLAPVQEGVLFHWLLDRYSGTDIEQIIADLREPVEPSRLERAWQRAVDSFDVLRTAFQWEGMATPRQRGEEDAIVPVSFEDAAGS